MKGEAKPSKIINGTLYQEQKESAETRGAADIYRADADTVRDYGKLLRDAGDPTRPENIEQVARWFEE